MIPCKMSLWTDKSLSNWYIVTRTLSRCQFHQHYTCALFVQKCFFCQNVTTEKLRKALSYKKHVRIMLMKLTLGLLMTCFAVWDKKNWIIWRHNNKMDEKGKVEIFEPFSFFRHLFASLEKQRGATPDGRCCQNIIQFLSIKIL